MCYTCIYMCVCVHDWATCVKRPQMVPDSLLAVDTSSALSVYPCTMYSRVCLPSQSVLAIVVGHI